MLGPVDGGNITLNGAGFIVTPEYAREKLGLGKRDGLEPHIRPYRNGRDLMQHSRGAWVIDLFGLTETQVMDRFPEVYAHVSETVKPERDVNRDKDIRRDWWLFGRARSEIRPALIGLPRYIATVETAKHRVFQFLDAAILADNKLLVIGSDDAFHLGILSSRFHVEWSIRAGGWLGVGNDSVYVKSKIFDPFPFPDASADQRAAITDIAERLDRHRRESLAETPSLTMTEIYNLRDMVARGTVLNRDQRDRATLARARIIDELHHQLDAAVAAAYGWPADLAPAEIVSRLVALNAARAAEEATGNIRWLRPAYQNPQP